MHEDTKIYFTILEDNELYALFISEKLQENFNCHISTYSTLQEFLTNINFDSRTDVFILDYNLPGGNGFDAIKKIRERKIDAEIILLSSQSDIQVALDALKAGAFEYVIKNTEAMQRLFSSIEKAIKIKTLRQENITLKIKMNKYKIFSAFMLATLAVWISVIIFS